MLNIKIIAIGTMENYFADAFAEYQKRLQKYCKFSIDVVKDTDAIKRALPKKCVIILCDVLGMQVSSTDLANQLESIAMTHGAVTFIIGGSDGVGNSLDDVVHRKMSFGKITLPHQLFRVILIEQIYRALTILKGEKYHK